MNTIINAEKAAIADNVITAEPLMPYGQPGLVLSILNLRPVGL